MSAWAEAVWVKSFIDTIGTTINAINSMLSTVNINVNDIKTTINSLNTKADNISTTANDTNSRVIAIGSSISNNTYGLNAIVNNSDYGLKTIADLAVKKNVVLAINAGTAAAPIPTDVSNSDVVNGALFFIES